MYVLISSGSDWSAGTGIRLLRKRASFLRLCVNFCQLWGSEGGLQVIAKEKGEEVDAVEV